MTVTNADLERLSAFPLVLVLATAACGASNAPGMVRTVVDSAGIEIVTLDVPEDAGADGSAADWRPYPDLGVEDGEDALIFSGVAGVARLSDGRLVVANGATSELRFFGADGTHERTVGRSGEGPGEFRVIAYIGVLPGDTLLVYDGRLRRLNRLDADGAFVDARPVTGVMLPYMAGLVDARTLVAWQFAGEDDDRLGVYAAPMEVGVVDIAEGTFRAIDEQPGSEESRVIYRDRLSRAFRPFGREGDVAAGGGSIHVLASTDDGAIRMYDAAGRLQRILRVRTVTPPVDAAAVGRWVEGWMDRFSSGNAEMEEYWRHGFRETPPPRRMPVFRSLAVDAAGNVCAERYPELWTSATRYWCFTPDGRFARGFELPAGVLRRGPHPYFDTRIEIGDDYVMGVWQDAMRVEHVRLYERPAGRQGRPPRELSQTVR